MAIRKDQMARRSFLKVLGKLWFGTSTDIPTLDQSHSGNGSEAAETKKRRKYNFSGSNCLFVSVVVETFGPLNPSANVLFSKLEVCGRGQHLIYARTNFLQCLSVTIQRANAQSVLGTAPQEIL